MSQYQVPYGEAPAAQPKTSGLAITSLVLGILGIIPCCGLVLGFVGALLGLAAVVSIGNNPARKGKGVAFTGIVLGLIFTIGWGGFLYWAYGFAKEYEAYMHTAPDAAMRAAYAGDAAGFKSNFHGSGANASDAEVQAFVDSLRAKYGSYVSCTIDESALQKNPPRFGQPEVTMPYSFTFEKGTASGDVQFIFGDQTTGEFLLKKLGHIEVNTPDGSPIVFPPQTGGPASGP